MNYENWAFDDITSVYLQLYDKLRYGILGGSIRPGEHLPAIREMAATLHINPNTVGKTYQFACKQELITYIRGKGYRATTDSVFLQKERDQEARVLLCTYIRRVMELGFSRQDATELFRSYVQTAKVNGDYLMNGLMEGEKDV